MSLLLKTPYCERQMFQCVFFKKQGVQQWWRAVWSDEDRPGGQRPPDQRRHGPGAGADV